MSLIKLIIYFGYLFLLINTLLYFSRYKSAKPVYSIFSIYLGYSLIIQITNWVLAENEINNLFLSHFYFVGQYVLFSYIYYTLLNSVILKKFIQNLSVLIILLSASNYLFNPELFYEFNLLEIISCSIPIVIFSALHLYQSLGNLKKEYVFISSGIFIYLICSTLIFASGNFVSPKETFWNQFIWLMNSILYLIYQILIYVEWYKNFRNLKPST